MFDTKIRYKPRTRPTNERKEVRLFAKTGEMSIIPKNKKKKRTIQIETALHAEVSFEKPLFGITKNIAEVKKGNRAYRHRKSDSCRIGSWGKP